MTLCLVGDLRPRGEDLVFAMWVFFFFVGFGEFNGFGNGGWQQIGYIQAQESSGYCEEEEEGCCWVFEEGHRGAA